MASRRVAPSDPTVFVSPSSSPQKGASLFDFPWTGSGNTSPHATRRARSAVSHDRVSPSRMSAGLADARSPIERSDVMPADFTSAEFFSPPPQQPLGAESRLFEKPDGAQARKALANAQAKVARLRQENERLSAHASDLQTVVHRLWSRSGVWSKQDVRQLVSESKRGAVA